jgi:hypothetical protein
MRTIRALLGILSLIALAAVLLVFQAPIRPGYATHDYDRGHYIGRRNPMTRLEGLTDNYRIASGRPKASKSVNLRDAAWRYARFLANVDGEGHHADGRDVVYRVGQTRFGPFCFIAENVYVYWTTSPVADNGFLVTDLALEWWKQSPGHNANMLHQNSNHFGVGFSSARHGNRYVYKAVQVFAAPPGTCL